MRTAESYLCNSPIFFPQIYGLYLVKLSVMLVLIGGVRVRGNAETGASKQRGESHLLLVGDPGTGKSQFLKYAAKGNLNISAMLLCPRIASLYRGVYLVIQIIMETY